jgi:hypothetical protein
MKYEASRAIVQQLKRRPTIQGILTPIVSAKDFQSYFKCVPDNTASCDQCHITMHAQMDQKMDWPTRSPKFMQQWQPSLWKRGSAQKDGDTQLTSCWRKSRHS